MKYLFILSILTSCASPGMYNVDELQDPGCYTQFGGEAGYCDKTEMMK